MNHENIPATKGNFVLMLANLMKHAIERHGLDRFYAVTFGIAGTIVRVYESDNGDWICDLWMENDTIKQSIWGA